MGFLNFSWELETFKSESNLGLILTIASQPSSKKVKALPQKNIWALFQSPPFSKYRVLCMFYMLLRLNAYCYAVKYDEQSVYSCRFVHHAKFHCIMIMLNKFFKIEFERRGGGIGKEPIFVG